MPAGLLKTLASYVPALITRRLAADPDYFKKPTAERFTAAVLFADISGFTALTERLAARGPAGAEEMTHLLNTYFGQLVDLITKSGGDCVKFAGDAVLALWPTTTSNEDLATLTRRVAQCGLAVQERLHAYEVAEGVRLSLKLAIGAGQLSFVTLGGVFDRWEFLVVGPPITQVGAANDQAQPGQIICSPEAWELLRDQCGGVAVADGHIRLESVSELLPFHTAAPPVLAPEAAAALRSFIPGAIRTRLDAGQTDWLAELRRVTILFVNLPDFKHRTALAQAQEAMCALQTNLYRYEGSINKISVDDKGTSLIAALGLPPLAHEDDATRGVRAALAMQSELCRLGFRSAIGVTTGMAFCGSVGSARRREYTLMGDVVNLAARLMQAAKDTILCEEPTAQAARGSRLVFQALPPLKVKGKQEPVVVYQPALSEPTSRADAVPAKARTRMVGRTQEREILAAHLEALLREGESSCLVIEGEAGIGKSRLVQELIVQTQAQGARTLSGAGDAIERTTAYYAWRQVFTDLFELDELDDAAVKRTRVLNRLPPDPKVLQLAPLLGAVLPLEWSDNEFTGQMTGEVRADNTHALLIRLLQEAASKAPLVLIIEDLHWIDSSSLALLLLVSQRVEPLLLAIATRPMSAPLPADYSQLLRDAKTRRLVLDTLAPEETLALACYRLGVESLPEPVAALILEKAEGNPFFSEELAYALRDGGLITISGGQCQIAPQAGGVLSWKFPDTIQGVITSRIDRLTPPQQLALKTASVIGRVFALRILQDIYPIEADRPHLADYLTALESLDLTSLDAPEPDVAYLFKHVITQQVAYDLMLFVQRRQLHQAVAEWYERTGDGHTSAHYPILAHHWSKAEVSAKAIEYLSKAGEQSLQRSAYREAVGFINEAIALDSRAEQPSDSGQRASWEWQLGEAYYGLGQVAESREHLERAVMLHGWAVPGSQGKLAASLGLETVRQVLHRIWLEKFIERDETKRTGLLEAALAYERLAQIYYMSSDMLTLIYTTFISLNLSEAAGPSPALARMYATISVAASMVPLHSAAKWYIRRAEGLAQRVQNLPALAWVYELKLIYGLGVGEWESANRAAERGREIAEQIGDARRFEEILGIWGWDAEFQGEISLSADLFTKVHASGERRNSDQGIAWGLVGLGKDELHRGRYDETIGTMSRALDLFRGLGDRNYEIIAYGLTALAHMRRGEWQLARESADSGMALIPKWQPSGCYTLYGYTGVTETYLGLWEGSSGDGEAMPKAARQALKALKGFARVFPIGRPRALLYRGWYDWLAGKQSKAHRYWQRSLTAAAQLRMPYEEGLAHYEIGRHAQEGAARRRHLMRACEIFTQLGAIDALQRAQAALDSHTARQTA